MVPNFASSNEIDSVVDRGGFARTGISFAPGWLDATTDAMRDCMACQSSPPDLLVVFVTSAWHQHYPEIISQIRTETGCRKLIGCSAKGVMAGECCHESSPGISIIAMWLPGSTITTRRIAAAPESWPWGTDVAKDDVRGILMFSDPYRVDAQHTLIGLRELCPGIPMIGALASKLPADTDTWVFLDGEVYSEGAVALTLEGPYDLLVRVSQGGTPTGEMWTMTAVDHNRILTISNRPAVDVLADTLALPENRGLTLSDLMIGLPMDEYQDEFWREDFVARGIIDTDEHGAILVGGIPRVGQSVQFLQRNARLAALDLDERLEFFQQLDRPIVGGILSSCVGRGSSIFGRNNHDAQAVAASLPDIPVAGLYSFGELAPVRGVPAYNAFAAALGVIVERSIAPRGR